MKYGIDDRNTDALESLSTSKHPGRDSRSRRGRAEAFAETNMEHRSSPRFEVSIPCTVEGVITGQFTGRIENISRSGLFLHLIGSNCRLLPVVGEVLTVDISLPANRVYGQKVLRCSGTVVRVSNSRRSTPALGISVDQMEFGQVFRSLSLVKSDGATRGYRSRHKRPE
jgi:hypothetical protein